jgi:hypothetical protein
LPAGESRVRAQFVRTTDQTVGDLFSLISFLFALALVVGAHTPVKLA